ncbi:MAG: NAD-dependent epimerase/dehydratase family protein [Bacteroidetes bacterium]|nr:NAD-dependent epimerase/dehydratase family protein [Bacteroidota bacterium]
MDKVFHCAAKVSFQPSDNEQMHHINVEGTANVVNLALLHGIKKLCHVSSVAALGRTGEEASLDETANWVTSKYNSAYAISKYGAEREVWRGVAEGLDAVIINPGVIIGPGNWKTDSSMLFRQVWKGLSFYTSGVNGFVDVRDVSETMICLMESDIINERYVVVAESKKFRDVFDYIADKIGRKRPGIHAGPLLTDMAWKFELMKSWFTGSKPVITKETARSAGNKTFYSNLKIKNALQMEFRSVDKPIEDAAEYFLKENQVFQ